MSPMSAEATVVRNYLEWILNIPWKERSRVKKDLKFAENILNKDHCGLEKGQGTDPRVSCGTAAGR